jgi:plasmid stabilization system protein ParE
VGSGAIFRHDLIAPNQHLEDEMPRAWSNKDERKYEHIKESSRERGASSDRAEEIAARTVNKGRRQEGRTPRKSTQGTGNPNRGYEARTKDELYNIAKDRGIEGRSSMSKSELVRALRK